MKKCYVAVLISYALVTCTACLFHNSVIGNAATISTSPWSTFQHDTRHTGRSPYKGPEKPALLWKFKTGGAIFTPPTIGSDGTIYTGSDDCYLYAINPDGTEKWRFKVEDAVRSTPVLDSMGTIYVGSRDNYLYVIYPDGTLKWKFKTEG